MVASAEIQWEIRIERRVPLKRHVAYRVLVNRIVEWWWHPFTSSFSELIVDWHPNGRFLIKDGNGQILNKGTILNIRPGWFFSMTDAIVSGRPASPSMVGYWSLSSVPRDSPDYITSERSAYVATIRHFSEHDYLRNRVLGIEQGWNDSADRFVQFCQEHALTFN